MTEQDKGPSPPSPASSASPLSKHTTMTTPDRQPSPAQPGHTHPSNITRDNNLDDIWGDSPPQSPHPDPDPTSTSASTSASHAASHDPNPNPTTTTTAPTTTTTTTTSRTINNEPLLSDLPSLRRQHMTAGYREGLGVGKARVMQGGFDVGYLVGVLIGLRVGRVLGVLEGVVAAAVAAAGAKGNKRGVGNGREGGERREGDEDGDGEEDGKMVRERRREEVQRLLEQARRELDRGLLLEGLDEDVVMRAEGVPERVEGVLRWWEGRVLGSFEGK